MQLRCGLLPTIVNISLILTSFVSELYVMAILANTPPITDVIRIKDRLLWEEITSNSANPLHELLPAQRARSLGRQAHNSVNTKFLLKYICANKGK